MPVRSGELKEIIHSPSSIETIDEALYNFIDKKMNISCETNKGWKKVPVIWVSAERSFDIKKSREFRDSNGSIILPAIALERKSITVDREKKGGIYGNVPEVQDEKGGSITVARVINQEKTHNFKYADSKRLKTLERMPSTRLGEKRKGPVVYETITIPLPKYVNVVYTINIRTEYQQQMNEVMEPFMNLGDGINQFFMINTNHIYEAFIEAEYNSETNVSDLGEEERRYETSVDIRVLGYILGDKNRPRKTIIRRENAVKVRIPREKVILGEVPLQSPSKKPFYVE